MELLLNKIEVRFQIYLVNTTLYVAIFGKSLNTIRAIAKFGKYIIPERKMGNYFRDVLNFLLEFVVICLEWHNVR